MTLQKISFYIELNGSLVDVVTYRKDEAFIQADNEHCSILGIKVPCETIEFDDIIPISKNTIA